MSAISIDGLVKTFGPTRALDGLDARGRRGRGPRLPRPQRRRQVDDDPRPARAAARRCRRARRCSAATRGARRPRCTAGSPTSPATSRCGRTSAAARRSTCSARLRGGLDETRRAELLERFELDPTKKGRAYSKGNRQKVALVAALASDVELLILDEPTSGLDPLMEEVFRACVADERERGRTVLLSSATSCPRSRRCATASRSSAPAARSRPARWRAAPPDPDHDRGRDRRRRARRSSRSSRASCRPCSRSSSRAGVKSLESRPPTLEELFLRHYQ